MYLGNSSSYNVINNFQLYEFIDARRALETAITSSYNTFNNGLLYNNDMNLRMNANDNTLNNIQIFNNKDSTMYAPYSGRKFNNVVVYNNT